MTREEAIKVLEMFLHKQCSLERTRFAYDPDTVWDAVKMAFDALEQPEPTHDAIIDYCRRLGLVVVDALDFYVMTASTKQPEQKTGKWTNVHISVSGNSDAECSLCGAVVHSGFADKGKINYCPNCGARMEEGE